MKYAKTLLFLLMLGCTLGMMAERKPKMQPVYAFGFSASFTDSVAFLTDVMCIDSAYLQANGFLEGRQLYSMQLENYVLEKCHVQNSTNAIYFSPNRKTIEKRYEKMNRKYQRSEELALIYVGSEEFQFKAVPYIPVEEEATKSKSSATSENTATSQPSKSKGDKSRAAAAPKQN